jgi:leader peptidase (prepilin peptidase) / N-methyltransferase
MESTAMIAALVGACVGSFLNLVAWRVPREESIVAPPSNCPHCGTRLRWHDNLPVLGWLLLRGHCRHCHRPIHMRYLLVELLTAGLWVSVLLAVPSAMGAPVPWLLLAAGWLFTSWLVPLVLIDIDQLWLPEPLCRWGVLVGWGVTAVLGFSQGEAVGRHLLLDHLIAAAVGLLAFEGLSALAEKALGRPALGLGDAKLTALLGAWLGLVGMGLAVALAVLGGALVGGLGRISGRLGPHQPFPFGPFVAAGGVALWLGGNGGGLRQFGERLGFAGL